MTIDPGDVLNVWIDPDHRPFWFAKSDSFDALLRDQFVGVLDEALTGAFDDWAEEPDGALALILLLDQFPRNIHRGSARAFACDAKALAVCQQTMAHGFDLLLDRTLRMFAYLPLEHAEDLAMQELAIARMATLGNPELVYYARLHYAVVERFGRFPHRNEILGRPSTAEEERYLASGGLRF